MNASSIFRGSLCLALTVGSALACTLAACGGQATLILSSDSGTSDSGSTDGGATQCATNHGTCSVPGAPVHCASDFFQIANACGDPQSTCCAPSPATNACTLNGGKCTGDALQGHACPPGSVASTLGCSSNYDCCLPIQPATCKVAVDCNGSPNVSSLMGDCVNGSCVCGNGFQLNSEGKCEAIPPAAENCTQAGGSCTGVGACSKGQGVLADLKYTCSGNGGASSACCFPTNLCDPEDFVCNAPNDACYRPNCDPARGIGFNLVCPANTTRASSCKGG